MPNPRYVGVEQSIDEEAVEGRGRSGRDRLGVAVDQGRAQLVAEERPERNPVNLPRTSAKRDFTFGRAFLR